MHAGAYEVKSKKSGLGSLFRGFLDGDMSMNARSRRLTLTTLVSLCASGGGLLFSATPALAAPPEAPEAQPATAISATAATLHGKLTPNSEEFREAGHYEFLYNRAPATECTGGKTAPVPAREDRGEPKEAVSVRLTGLQPGTEYTVCLLDRDVEGETTSLPVTFTTAPQAAPKVEEEYATDVSSAGATLSAKIDPEGAETAYRFEYGKGAGYQPVPGGEGSIGEGVTGVLVSVHAQSLESDTTYHYRVVATNALSPVGGPPGLDQTFTTQSSDSEFTLADGRQWELVSPPDKQGSGIEPMVFAGAPIQAAEAGGAITYTANGPVVADPAGNRAPQFTQILSTRGADGWTSRDIMNPYSAVTAILSRNSEYDVSSSDLSVALVEPGGEVPLPPLREGAEKTIYLRNNSACEPTPTETIPPTCYLPLVTAANVPPGRHFGEIEKHNTLHFAGATPNLSHVVIGSREALTPNITQTNEVESLYEWAGGELQLVSLLPPNGKGEEMPAAESAEEASLGYNGELVRSAVSSDGSRIVWEAGRHLYLRDMSQDKTIQLDVQEAGAGKPGEESEPIFQGASSDGSRIFFTDQQQLTTGSKAKEREPDLYVFEVTSGGGEPLAGKLTDLTVDANANESADVRGVVLGYSEDGSYVYFAANGALAAGAVPGECSEQAQTCLYMDHYDGTGWEPPRFIARLSEEDGHDWAEGGGTNLGHLTARSSPNGRYLAFMSSQQLTGYDNLDAASGQPDEEVYLFDSGAGRIACASCDPTGARPEGLHDMFGEPPLIDRNHAVEGWLAGSIPGWTEEEGHRSLYQPRYLSNEGRLFFDGADSLVPADVNHKEDVYEYEPEGKRCNSSTQSASEVFKREGKAGEETAGCVALISSGVSSQESAFLDASGMGPGGEEGEEVFFMTSAPLVAQDTDNAYDVYDAHICSGVSPCPPSAASVPPACTTADSCRAASPPQPAIFGAPTSATFSGAGNVVAQSPPPKKATKKTVKCKRDFVKNKKGKCVRRKSKKQAKRASRNRRTGR
jgi:hypothetical protein